MHIFAIRLLQCVAIQLHHTGVYPSPAGGYAEIKTPPPFSGFGFSRYLPSVRNPVGRAAPPKHSVLLWQRGRQRTLGILPGMRVIRIRWCPAVGYFAALLIPPKPSLPLTKHPLPLRLEVLPIPRPVRLAVLAVLPRQLLRLFVDPIKHRQTVG